MKQSRRRIILLPFLVIAGICVLSASARALEYYGIESTINDDLTVKTTLTIKFTEPVQSHEFMLLYKAYNLTTTSSFDSAQCTLSDDRSGSRIDCRFTGMTETKNLFTLTFYTKSGISSFQNSYNFSLDYRISEPIKTVFAIIKIPQNSVLSEESANESYFPRDGKILSDGKRIMVYWEMENLTASSGMVFSVSYIIPFMGAYNNILVVSVAGVVIISMIAVAVYVRRGGYGAESTADLMTSVLNKDEKKIVDILSRHGGKSGQKVIVRESDFSKAKVSRLVKNLRERGVVDIEPISGRENRIILKFDKKPEPEKPQEKESKPETTEHIERPQKDPVIETESYGPDEEIVE